MIPETTLLLTTSVVTLKPDQDSGKPPRGPEISGKAPSAQAFMDAQVDLEPTVTIELRSKGLGLSLGSAGLRSEG